ncbi:MAG: recombinase family protein [Melioribacteraceae bacterium]|nr:recombinase family protein [Melioribacteraceae bacterium]MCF8266130.1 recombinase family protein [Melioribacteraceae bacterium]MCF8413364.1 recombinase family protein [Melioribacteraceae bacterium]MCF8432777.1 recombinase family protein [Melioribacteraceae bacterium]
MSKSSKKAYWSGYVPPYGYRYNSANKSLDIDQNENEILLSIFSLARANKSALEIAKELNRHGIKTRRGKMWNYTTISNLLSKDRIAFAAGIIDDKPGANWEPIIDKSQYHDLRKIELSREKSKHHRKRDSLLTGQNILKCGYCGGAVKSAKTKKNVGEIYYYRCSDKQIRGADYCPESKLIQQSKVDDIVINNLSQILNNPLLLKQLTEYNRKSTELFTNRMSQIQDKITSLLMIEKNLFTNKEMVDEEIKSLKKDRKKIIDQIDSLLSPDDIPFRISKKQINISVIKKTISRIEIFEKYVTIHFSIPIDENLKTTENFNYG